MKNFLHKCIEEDCRTGLAIMIATIIAMIGTPKEKKIKFKSFTNFFWTTISVVLVTVLAGIYLGFPLSLSTGVAFLLGRNSKKVEKMMIEKIQKGKK